MKKTVVLTFVTLVLIGYSEPQNIDVVDLNKDSEKLFGQNKDSAMATVQFMNYMNYVAYTLSSYRNVFVIEEEYRKLSQDNLNMNIIPDETVKNAIKDMLKLIKEMRVEDKKRERFLKKQEQLAQAAKEKMWTDILTGLVANGLPAGQKTAQEVRGNLGADATKTAVTLAMSANVPLAIGRACGGQIIGSYLAYQQTQARLEQESDDYKFEYDMEKDKNMHEHNTNQLDLQYKLTKEYKINDKEQRMSTENAKDFVKCLKSDNKEGVYEQLRYMLQNNAPYRHFPMFWCNFAAFALETGHPKEAIEACNHFEEVNRFSIFKHDPMAAQVAMTRITALLEIAKADVVSISMEDKEDIRKSLKTIERYNYNTHNVDMAYFCATTYDSVLDDPASATDILRPLIARLQDEYDKHLVNYCDLVTPEEPEMEYSDAPPLGADLSRCHLLLKNILAERKSDSLPNVLRQICERTTTASIEKLYLVGDTRISDLWDKAKEDVLAINLVYEKRWSGNVVAAYLPLSWFALGEMKLSLDLMRGTNVIERIPEQFMGRRIVGNHDGQKRTYIKVEMICPANSTKGIDAYVLRIPHRSWPIELRYAPQVGASIAEGRFEADESRLIPTSIVFMGEKRELVRSFWGGSASFSDISENERDNASKILHTVMSGSMLPTCYDFVQAYKQDNVSGFLKDSFEDYKELCLWGYRGWLVGIMAEKYTDKNEVIKVLDFAQSVSDIKTNGFLYAQVEATDFCIAYTNATSLRWSVSVDATFFNSYGALMYKVQDEKDFGAWGGGEFRLKMPTIMQGCESPACVVLKCSRNRGAWKKGLDRVSRWRKR